MEIGETRPRFWLLVAALADRAVVTIGGLMLAIAASNVGVDQKAAVETANEIQAETDEKLEAEVEGLEAEMEDLAAQVAKLEKKSEKAQPAAP